jgi:hypothetical protein
VYIESSSPRLVHTTIARNGGQGEGVHVTNRLLPYSSVYLVNTILVNHRAGITVTSGNGATLEATLWGAGVWGNGTDWGGEGAVTTGTRNVWGDPRFVDPDAGDYHLAPGSWAIDRGVDAGVTTDIDGDPRPGGCRPDVGADEVAGGACHCHYLPAIMRRSGW